MQGPIVLSGYVKRCKIARTLMPLPWRSNVPLHDRRALTLCSHLLFQAWVSFSSNRHTASRTSASRAWFGTFATLPHAKYVPLASRPKAAC
jgi:hypothetical protein